MSKLREIKNRIKSVKNIGRITKSMQMIAASKMKKAEQTVRAGKFFNQQLCLALEALTKDASLMENTLFVENTSAKKLVIVFSPKGGFTGPMLGLEAAALFAGISNYPKENVDAILVGRRLTKVVSGKVSKILSEFQDFGANPTSTELLALAQVVLEYFVKGEYSEVFVLYVEYHNSLHQKPVFKKILPVNAVDAANVDAFSRKQSKLGGKVFLFEPDKAKLLESISKLYIENSLYQFHSETFASELAYRVLTMKNASERSLDVGGILSQELHKVRQDAVTRELAEITVEVANA